MKKCAIFLNQELGLKILKIMLDEDQIQVKLIVLNEENTLSELVKELISKSNLSYRIEICNWREQKKVKNFLEKHRLDLGVSVLFRHIFDQKVINGLGQFINLHPSYLPIGRGAHPICWSIIERLPCGVTIHEIDEGIDTGPIILRKKIPYNISDTSGHIYQRSMRELEKMFRIFIKLFLKKRLTQSDKKYLVNENKQEIVENATFHLKQELETIKVITEKQLLSAGDFIRRIQALNFANGQRAIFTDEKGKKWNLEICMTPIHEVGTHNELHS